MVTSPLSILFEIFFVIFYNSINTLMVIFNLFIELIRSLGYGIAIAGPLGIILTFLILAPLVYFLVKFFFSSIKVALVALLILFLFFVFIFLIV